MSAEKGKRDWAALICLALGMAVAVAVAVSDEFDDTPLFGRVFLGLLVGAFMGRLYLAFYHAARWAVLLILGRGGND